jgi:hypothetical protein
MELLAAATILAIAHILATWLDAHTAVEVAVLYTRQPQPTTAPTDEGEATVPVRPTTNGHHPQTGRPRESSVSN